MSFSSDLKTELSEIYVHAAHCRIAELSALTSLLGKYSDENIIIKSEKEQCIAKISRLIRKTFDNSEKMMYTSICSGQNVIKIEKSLANEMISTLKLSIKGEEIYSDDLRAEQIIKIIKVFDIYPKVVVRRNSYVVYLKDGDEIANILSVIEAPNALMTFENFRIVKDIRNSINREVNCETANISKIAGASVKQIEDIEFIDKLKGRDFLPDSLREVADIRVENPLLSLKELGEMMNPPIGKSGVNHRLRRISILADKLREEL